MWTVFSIVSFSVRSGRGFFWIFVYRGRMFSGSGLRGRDVSVVSWFVNYLVLSIFERVVSFGVYGLVFVGFSF